MAVLYVKKSKTKREIGKAVASTAVSLSKTCTNCGEEARVVEVYPNYSTFKCTKCNTVLTYNAEKKESSSKVKKLGAIVLRDRSQEKKEEEPSTPTEHEDQVHVPVIREGMQGKKLIAFKYVDRTGSTSTRTVEPYKLTRQGNEIILFAYCTDSHGIRSFKVSRITTLEILPYTFEPQYPIEDQLN